MKEITVAPAGALRASADPVARSAFSESRDRRPGAKNEVRRLLEDSPWAPSLTLAQVAIVQPGDSAGGGTQAQTLVRDAVPLRRRQIEHRHDSISRKAFDGQGMNGPRRPRPGRSRSET